MERTTSISLAGMSFTLEEPAYIALREYMDSLKEHFAQDPDSAEIIRDIEARIAEKLSGGTSVVTKKTVDAIIADIGHVSDLGGSEKRSAALVRKLYRNPDDAVIAGIASGIAAYFGIDAIIVRLIFILTVFGGGTGIVVYLLLWLLIPEAKTAAQKLEMHGSPVTLDAVRDVIKSRIDETRERGTLSKVAHFPVALVSALSPALRKLIGIILAAGSFFAILGVTVAMSLLVANLNSPFVDFPMRDATSHALIYGVLAATYLVAVIPLVFILLTGRYLIHKRKDAVPAMTNTLLIGVWSLAIIASGVFGTRIAGDFYQYTRTSPEYAPMVRDIPIDPVTSIRNWGNEVSVVNGTSTHVILRGAKHDVESMEPRVENGELTVDYRDKCIFCIRQHVDVTLVVPNANEIKIRNDYYPPQAPAPQTY